MDFTKEEISLCKQVAEKHRKELVYGDWFISYDGGIKLKALHQKGHRHEENIPLWTISDCLEFLIRKPRVRTVEVVCDFKTFSVSIRPYGTFYGNTSLEAYLKAVLAVLDEGK